MNLKLALCMMFSVAQISCASYECRYYKSVIADDETARTLEAWADQEVFNGTYAYKDYHSDLSIVGPGRRTFSNSSGVSVPAFWNGPYSAISSVRVLGADLTRPEGVFLGERSFAGIVIARESLEEMLAKSKMTSEGLDGTNGRIAAMCRRD
jgi:hypothetical protein